MKGVSWTCRRVVDRLSISVRQWIVRPQPPERGFHSFAQDRRLLATMWGCQGKSLSIELPSQNGILASARMWHLIAATFGMHADGHATTAGVVSDRQCKIPTCSNVGPVRHWCYGATGFHLVLQVPTNVVTAPIISFRATGSSLLQLFLVRLQRTEHNAMHAPGKLHFSNATSGKLTRYLYKISHGTGRTECSSWETFTSGNAIAGMLFISEPVSFQLSSSISSRLLSIQYLQCRNQGEERLHCAQHTEKPFMLLIP